MRWHKLLFSIYSFTVIMVFKFNLVAKRKMESCELHIITLCFVIQMYEQYHYDIKECPIFMNKN